MSNNRGKNIWVAREMITSQAYLALPGTAAKVLMWFLARRQYAKVGRKRSGKWINHNNGEIFFTYAEAQKRFGLNSTTFRRVIDNLIKFGLIDINHHGGGMVNDATTYFISDRWRDYGTDEFKEESRPKDTRGLGFTKENWEEMTGKKRRNG